MTETEYTAALRRAFVDGKADFITVDGWSGPFLHASLAHGKDKGWLVTRELHGDQYTAYEGRLTPAGREAFGLPPLEPSRAMKLEAENARLLAELTIAQEDKATASRWVEERDRFLVEREMWSEFVAWLEARRRLRR